MRRFALLILLGTALMAEHPRAFSPLASELEAELDALKALAGGSPFERESIDAYADRQQACFEQGYALDAALDANESDTGSMRSNYLGCLRKLQRDSVKWQHRYAQTLEVAMDTGDRARFSLLVSHPLSPLQRPSIKRKALAFYEGFRDKESIAEMETIREDMRIEERSPAFLSTEKSAFVKAKKVLDTDEASTSDRPVLVTTKREGSRFVFMAKNRNIYPVTVSLSIPEHKNFRASRPLPVVFELAPYATRRVLEMDVIDKRQGASFSSRYGWVMGRLDARHSDPLYRLPFAVGSKALVSQGFDGGVTHKGLTRYAVDFQCPVGTKVYAARGGKVISVESSHNKGGFDKRFGDEANYIIIEHDDHTLGKYYHLKQYGVIVRVGESVRRGEFIGYSGNTGYTSGPHLHFSVSGVDPASKALPVTLPFLFKSAKGVVTAPKTGDVYRVVKVR